MGATCMLKLSPSFEEELCVSSASVTTILIQRKLTDGDWVTVSDNEEVPVDGGYEDAAADDVAEGGGDHALPDVVADIDIRVAQEDGNGDIELRGLCVSHALEDCTSVVVCLIRSSRMAFNAKRLTMFAITWSNPRRTKANTGL